MSKKSKKCICPTKCDCQNPKPKEGVAGVSNHCPEHNQRPAVVDECPADEHRGEQTERFYDIY